MAAHNSKEHNKCKLNIVSFTQIIKCPSCKQFSLIVLTKRKVVLDQFREGLKLLGVLDQITPHPKLYEKLFVAVNEYDATDVLDKICFVNPDGNNHLVTYFKRYISGKVSEYLLKFIIFCCGGCVLPTKPIKVGFYFRESFFVSTCSFKLDCSNAFTSFEEFENAFDAAIHTSFNVV